MLLKDLSNRSSACESINQHVSRGDLGEKTGQGYYNWTEATSSKIQQAREQELIRWLKKDQPS